MRRSVLNRDDQIKSEELPSSITLAVTRGTAPANRRIVEAAAASTTKLCGPDWYYHMDRNGDGDLSRNEFLGTADRFHRLDSNQDGFLELQESEALAP
jgi:hypothetical protein